jgi:hypothetical protein
MLYNILMGKEREPEITDGGYSEKQLDLSVDQLNNQNQVKARNIFDPKKKEKGSSNS